MDKFSLLPLLQSLPYFAHVPAPSLEHIAYQAVPRKFAPNEMIFLEGEPTAGLWIIEEGQVKAFKLSPDGQEYILKFFGPGEIFNKLAALDSGPNATSATAMTEVTAWMISTEVFSEALQKDHELALAVLQGLVERVRDLVDKVEDLALRPVTARLARFLLEQVEDPVLAHPAVTRALIANHLATTPESISRSLRTLEEAGTIRFDRHRIIVIQPELLRKMAQQK